MSDLIRRKAAIDAVRELYIQSPKINNDIVYDMAIDQAYDALVSLPSAQPEKTQLSEEDATSDCISRQAAISLPVKPKEDRYFQTQNLDDAYELGWFACQKCIEDLPSAQPETHEERTETHGVCLDTIDRQAVLDWLKNEWNGMVTSLFDGIKALPSAQPEIIHCRDCRWRKDQSGSTAWLPCRAIVTPSDFYCGRAERRTDGN